MSRVLASVRTICFALGLFVVAFPAESAETRKALGPSVLRTPVLERESERGILTPVPLELELPKELRAERVLVHYRIHGSKDWTTLELGHVGERWRGAIPCLEVSTITGDIIYYIRVHDASGAVIAYSGSRYQPYRVTILHDSVRRAPVSEMGRCPDPADCPPGLPGCPSERIERIPCKTDADCEGGTSCGWDGFCEYDSRSYNWLSLEVEGGLGAVSTAGACSVRSQESEGYVCRRSDGETYVGSPVYTNEPIAIGPAPLRAVFGVERLIQENTRVGARFGYAFLGEGPTPPGGNSFVPYSAELRASHFFGRDPFAHAGLRPYAFVAGGYGMYDIQVSVRVREDVELPVRQGGNDLEQTLEVWKRAGDGFVSIGSGLVFATSSGFGLSGEVRMVTVFPFGALVLTGALGTQIGF